MYLYIQPGGSSSSWDVRLSSSNYYSDNTSTSNAMTPGHFLVGQELYGTSGANAPYAYFTVNEYEDTSNNWHYFNWDGSLQYNNPPWVGYQQPPSQSSTGGSIFTNCC